MPSYLVGYNGKTYCVTGQYHRPLRHHARDQPPELEWFEILKVELGNTDLQNTLTKAQLLDLERLILRDYYQTVED